VRVRFAPSAAGARLAVLHVRYGAGTAAYDVPLAATGTAESTPDTTSTQTSTTLEDGSTSTTASTAPATSTTTVTTPVATPPAATKKPNLQPLAKKKPARLILTLSHRKLTAKTGAPVAVGFALGRAASIVLRVKRAGHTVEIVRGSGHEGRGSLKWDGRLGSKAAPKGTYRIDVYAVAADGRAARASVALTVK
jgi:hypothetical protein